MGDQLFLGIEIGGTKLQLGVGSGHSGDLVDLVRREVNTDAGAQGIVAAIEDEAATLCIRHRIQAVGIGFGGPVNVKSGVVTKSHQIQGWDGFPLADRVAHVTKCNVRVDNDCNVAALGEAKLGAGRGCERVFYVTVGTGIGGGFVIDGKLDGSTRPAISEIGHLRPGPDAEAAEDTIESIASGWGIAAYVRSRLESEQGGADNERLRGVCGGELDRLTTKHIADAAAGGNHLALSAIARATKVLGWGIAQVITLAAPEIVIVGGGVSLMGDMFFDPLREQVGKYVFAPLANSFQIANASLGEEVVVHGAIQLVAESRA